MPDQEPTTLADRSEERSGSPSSGDSRTVLELRDVSVSFGGVAALTNMSFAVEKNEVAAIVGPNGAGKTTVLNAINGLIRRNCRGSIQIAGREVAGLPAPRIAKRSVGRSFQHPHMIETATVLENVMCGTYLAQRYTIADQVFRRRAVPKAEAASRDAAMRALERVGLSAVANVPVASLPYGSQKLVDIARALAGEPMLLLLDEPSSGLDGRERNAVRDVLIQLREQTDTTILVVEHHMDLVRRAATVVIGLQAGSVIRMGTPGEVLDSEEFREAVIGHKRDAPVPGDEDGEG